MYLVCLHKPTYTRVCIKMVNMPVCNHGACLQQKESPLNLASYSGHDEVCQLLLQAGVNVQAVDFVSIRISTYIVFHSALLHVLCVVVWHTGKVLSCGAVGPQFNSWQGQGIL